MATNKQTVLHSWHQGHGANMALFGNYDMPLWYKTGAKSEHLAVIQHAGIFDTSHMAVVAIKGRGARALLQQCFSKDLDFCLGQGGTELVDGRCVYGVFLTEDGSVVDDAIVYKLQDESFMVVVNAGMGGTIANLLLEKRGDQTVAITDLTDRIGKMDIQGPDAARILKKIIKDPAALFDSLVYFSFKGGFGELQSATSVELVDGTPLFVSRTGYTGEFGFELFVAADSLVPLWNMVLEAGDEQGILACGLAARDSLRAGAVLPLSHQDIGSWPFLNNPWPFALPYNAAHTGFTKDFVGADALLQADWDKYTLPFAGFDPRKIPAGNDSFVTDKEGKKIGTILTCTTDMAIGRDGQEIVSIAGNPDFAAKGLCCGFVLLDKKCPPGEQVILSDGKRKITVEIRKNVRPDRTARKAMRLMVD